MSDLREALARIGETGPERPLVCMENVAEWSDYAIALESLLLRVCERLERAERKCPRCKGRGWFRGGHAEDDFEITCNDCKGTGKEQGR